MKHTLGWLDGERQVAHRLPPGAPAPLSNEVQSFPPKARVY